MSEEYSGQAFGRRRGGEVLEPGDPGNPEPGEEAADLAAWAAMMAPGEFAVEELSPDDVAALSDAKLTVRLAAKRERVCETTVLRWIRSGTLDASKVGNRYRITTDALDARAAASLVPKVKPEPPKRRRRRSKGGAATTGGDLDWFTR